MDHTNLSNAIFEALGAKDNPVNVIVELVIEKELTERDSRIKELEEAMQWFVDRCDNGEVRSIRTYDRYKELLGNDI